MYKLEDIKEIHLELTTKCQARCPMCPRRINGGMQNPLFNITEIDLSTFKKWFNISFLKQLDSIFLCGNLGDPIIAQDCLEILEYVRSINQNIKLSIHTNGSARNIDWWKRMAKTNTKVAFGIDGLADTHNLYRINTDWYKIIENAQAFINEGGHAEWQMLAFKHNEHQIDDCRKLSKEMNFKKFNLKHTSRFTDNEFRVLDDSGRTTHVLKPTKQSERMIPIVSEASSDQCATIHCKAKTMRQLYISAEGIISPCCWLDFSWVLHKQDRRIDYMDKIGIFPNLHNQQLLDIFNSGYFNIIESTWAISPLKECSRQCGKFDKLGEQFEN
jgi:MoaA/NifB/PqqE/SkfB family radical SAM enzyme